MTSTTTTLHRGRHVAALVAAALSILVAIGAALLPEASAEKGSTYPVLRLVPPEWGDALRRDNVNLPTGDVRDRGNELIVRTLGEFRTVAQMADVVVTSRTGRLVSRTKRRSRLVRMPTSFSPSVMGTPEIL